MRILPVDWKAFCCEGMEAVNEPLSSELYIESKIDINR